MQSQQLLTESQVFKDEVLTETESADHPAEEMSERRDHTKYLIETIRIQLCAKSFILQMYDVLARNRCYLLLRTHLDQIEKYRNRAKQGRSCSDGARSMPRVC